MWNNVVLLTKHRVSTTWVHARDQIQAARVWLNIRGSGEDTHSHDDSRTAVFDTDEGTSGGSGNGIVNEALFSSEKRYFSCTEEIIIQQIVK
jgi:hypothetical protein